MALGGQITRKSELCPSLSQAIRPENRISGVKSKSSSIRTLSTRSRIFISLALLAVIFVFFIDYGRVAGIILSIDGLGLMALICIALFQRFFSAYRWYALVKGKSPNISLYRVFRITFISNFLGIIMPGSVGGDLVRIFGLARMSGDLAMSFTSVFIERCLGLFTLAILALVGLTSSAAYVSPDASVVVWLLLATLVFGLLAITNNNFRALTRRALAFPFLNFVRTRIERFYSALDEYRLHPATLVWAVVLAFALQLIRFSIFVVGAWALGLQIPITFLFIVVPVAIIAQMLPISIGGLGVKEMSLTALLSIVGVDAAAAVSLSLITSLALALAGGLPGAILCCLNDNGDSLMENSNSELRYRLSNH